MSFSEADTRAKLIDSALYRRGWTEDLIRREKCAGVIHRVNDPPRRRTGRVDYTLRIRQHTEEQPLAVALIEAKRESVVPANGLEQAKRYADPPFPSYRKDRLRAHYFSAPSQTQTNTLKNDRASLYGRV